MTINLDSEPCSRRSLSTPQNFMLSLFHAVDPASDLAMAA
jgi:hypothetical protein